ncbi:MAG: N-6 DNA methylase [Candidatus Babeliales bacterium]|nr:N-6 DNA methylase [Candidatus Babeliales bacterium]
MMNADTKRHIDAARRVLVGVVPSPTSQIDQITNALIYKFMDDMDQAAIKAGGEPSFFVDDLERYAWTSLMNARMGNQERMDLYSKALEKFSQAKQLPELFRDIFKSAFLPYRSPETLGLFLKEIAYFNYSHPEELGNAYEYLLSILSSQGDAGQFRTPRHIIDFIVNVINPTKDDRVLDPGCGTGGFLVSSYKHILKQHLGNDNSNNKALTPSERKKLMNNFEGYDIDPTMVRIAQVNMYLHQFKNPKIYNYDTLSSDDRWNDKFDVILANPPFMSPKGGIRPHHKFSIQSSRSEVLFVDYIMNHLKPKGRAGIIVPEGIIFQSGSTYKQLRKNLVENGLYAVVSLPSGVFQPYSGVKTSILLFDNELAKKNSEMLFVKIENDGFDLGANKRSIDKNDLPKVLEILNKWKIGEKVEDKIVVYVEKSKIAESGDYNFSGDGYRIATDYTNAKWPIVELGDICTFEYGKPLKEENRKNGEYPVFGSNGVVGYHNEYLIKGPFIIVGRKGTAGAVTLSEKNGFPIDTTFHIQLSEKNTVELKYLYYILLTLNLGKINVQAGVPGLNRNDAYKVKIPLPPLEIQEKIVAELDSYSGIISGSRQVIENWKPKIDIDPKWEKVEIGNICKLFNGKVFKTSDWEKKNLGGLPIIRIQNLNKDRSEFNYFSGKVENQIVINCGDLLFSWSGSRGTSFGPHIWQGDKAILNQHIFKVTHKDNILRDFFYLMLKDAVKEVENNLHGGVGLVHITKGNLEKIKIPLPPLDIQKQIVERIEAERALVESTKKLIAIYEQKTKEAIDKLWNE